MTHTLIETLSESLYHDHEQLWAGLALDWSRVTPATFRRAYEYVSQYSGPLGHLLDLHQMVGEFCRAEWDYQASPLPALVTIVKRGLDDFTDYSAALLGGARLIE